MLFFSPFKLPIHPVNAMEFENKGVSGNFDTTISWGVSSRIQSRDPALIAISSGGSGFSSNVDDGNLNYNRGLISNAVKVTHDLDINYENLWCLCSR